MPSPTLPTEADLLTIWRACVDVLEETRKFGNVNADNFVDKANVAILALAPDHQSAVGGALAAARARLASCVSVEQAASILTPLLRTYARVIGVPDTSTDAMWDELYDYYVAQSKRVTTRAITFGSVTAGASNAGTGTLLRLTKDAQNFDIEAVHIETKLARCVADEHSGGAEHEETFELRGEPLAFDALEYDGSGEIIRTTAISARSTSRYLDNPSFSSLSGGTDASPTGILGWTVSTIANVEITRNTGEYYRDFVGDLSPGALELKNNVLVSQNLNRRNVRIDDTFPYFLQVAYNRQSSCDGTLTLRLGSKSASVVLSTATNNTWALLRIGPSSDNWFENWNEEDPTVEIELSGRTTGTVFVDDVLFGPFFRFDRTYIAIVGGATPFLSGDTFTWTDTGGATGVLQYWSWRAFGRYLPHSTGGTVTWAEP